ncbi:DUF4190 domain-containing protein [Saccharopolyspora halophila]|uniref:DUF4190 domain-containing protein n=1 Tax=Saccharopolyspora halophila TaxID=405551 RepID=UPI0031DD1224
MAEYRAQSGHYALLGGIGEGQIMVEGEPSRATSNGMGTAALILGIIGVLLAFIPIIGFFGFILGVLAIVLGAIGIVRAHRGTASNKVIAYVGTALGAVAFIGSLVVFGGLMSSIDESVRDSQVGAPRGPASGGEPQPPAAGGSGDSAQGEVISLAFGQSHTWPGGETVTLAEPRAHTPDNPYSGPAGDERQVAVDVTVRNDGDDEYDVMQTRLTAQHNGRVAQQAYTAGDPLPNVQLPPGGETTFTTVYSVGPDPGELQISVQPNYFAEQTVYYRGQF